MPDPLRDADLIEIIDAVARTLLKLHINTSPEPGSISIHMGSDLLGELMELDRRIYPTRLLHFIWKNEDDEIKMFDFPIVINLNIDEVDITIRVNP